MMTPIARFSHVQMAGNIISSNSCAVRIRTTTQPYMVWQPEGWPKPNEWSLVRLPSRASHRNGRNFHGLIVDYRRRTLIAYRERETGNLIASDKGRRDRPFIAPTVSALVLSNG